MKISDIAKVCYTHTMLCCESVVPAQGVNLIGVRATLYQVSRKIIRASNFSFPGIDDMPVRTVVGLLFAFSSLPHAYDQLFNRILVQIITSCLLASEVHSGQ